MAGPNRFDVSVAVLSFIMSTGLLTINSNRHVVLRL